MSTFDNFKILSLIIYIYYLLLVLVIVHLIYILIFHSYSDCFKPKPSSDQKDLILQYYFILVYKLQSESQVLEFIYLNLLLFDDEKS